jgi:hypothetical protein
MSYCVGDSPDEGICPALSLSFALHYCLQLAPGAFESDEDEVPMKGNVDDDDDIGDIEDSDKEDHHHHHHHHHHNRYKGGYEDVDRLKGDNMEFQYMESDRGPGHPLTALEVLVKTATADSISGSDDFDDSGGLFSS